VSKENTPVTILKHCHIPLEPHTFFVPEWYSRVHLHFGSHIMFGIFHQVKKLDLVNQIQTDHICKCFSLKNRSVMLVS
jgi:hypothetical protein